MTENIQTTPYELAGGEATILSLVERFYFFMDTLPEAAGIRAMHAANLSDARTKLFKFLSGWLGGPDLFIQEYGHPRLRQRHFPFAIDEVARDQWMLCMNKALNEIAMDVNLRENLRQALQQLATHMINQDD
ncbi:MAG: group II truncated hemoglobin [Methylobacter sp.]|uniref:group II truncated hemoglobin n=1 Tax=Methylobacter sp. TaxID=2051955 RepID=UPI00272780F4|nr:group II truncated hemoglobin [Methylobacter sp.]MDO9269386.1 group II truncated hemoglobin [Methylobacter sp.]MDP1665497.1 group II truncated hemoglobin [Methylobacter sp.]MDP1969493.1 group II truncated hemoglobin [Methylobacter sp.]